MSEAFEKAKEQLGDLADLLHTWHAPMTDEEKLIASNAAVRLVDEALEALESQNQALQEENERLKVQLRYAARPTMGLPANTDPVEWARDHATDKAVRDALVTCIAGATLALSPTQETDPE